MYGESYRWYNLWRHIEGKMYGYTFRVQYTETLIEDTMYGGSYRGYNVWRII